MPASEPAADPRSLIGRELRAPHEGRMRRGWVSGLTATGALEVGLYPQVRKPQSRTARAIEDTVLEPHQVQWLQRQRVLSPYVAVDLLTPQGEPHLSLRLPWALWQALELLAAHEQQPVEQIFNQLLMLTLTEACERLGVSLETPSEESPQ